MKKLIYSLAMVVMVLASCTKFDDPVTENYGNGPDIQVAVTPGVPADSVFTITLTPAAGTSYYSFAVGEGEEAESLDAQTLLKGGYGNPVLNASEHPSFTMTISDADPNTSYVVYAVACSDKGICGNIAVAQIKTGDAGVPGPVDFEGDADNKTMYILFSEDVKRGSGDFKVQYYIEKDIMNPVTLPADSVQMDVSGKVVTVVSNALPAGAYVTYSWSEGAFVDGAGNNCRAFTSGLDMTKGTFTGINMRVTTVPFEITDENVTSPEAGSLFDKWEEFKGELTFDFDVYRYDRLVKDGDVSVVYVGEGRTAIYKLTAEQWSVSGNKLTFTLPASPAAGEQVFVTLVEGAITDKFGNPNVEYTSEVSWLFFAPTKEMILGDFDFTFTSAYDEEPVEYDGGKVTITDLEDGKNGVMISNLFDGGEGFEVAGTYDLSSAKVTIPGFQAVGEDEYQGIPLYLVLYNVDGETSYVSFTINANGTLTSDNIGLLAVAVETEDILGWWEKCATATLTPAEEAAAKAFKAKKAGIRKALKNIKLPKNLRSLKKISKK
ncbi:MAG: hypothetical protein IKH86_11185 [Prevotella sp.]|nr:hypothetical protein [Prevotella sp.]MBR6964172.1 hypothetical protein [Prevotella sp.]